MGVDKWNNTYYPTGSDAANLHKEWYIIDAEGQTLGRLANLAATYLRGKNKVTYTPSMDMGAYVVIINADKVAVTGKKETDKLYYRHTVGRPGSLKIEALRDLRVVSALRCAAPRCAALRGWGEGVRVGEQEQPRRGGSDMRQAEAKRAPRRAGAETGRLRAAGGAPALSRQAAGWAAAVAAAA